MAGYRRDAEFTAYMQASTPWLRRIAYLLCQDEHRADDLTQSAYLKAYLNWERAKRAENRDGYLRTILVNTFLSEQRTTWWKRMTLHRASLSEEAYTTEVDGSIDLLSALEQIPARQRAALVLRFYCDLPVTETAALLECSPGTVKSQTSRGLDALRLVLGTTRASMPAPESAPVPSAEEICHVEA